MENVQCEIWSRRVDSLHALFEKHIRLSLWRLLLCFWIVHPYTHVPSFVILHFMTFVSISTGLKRFAQMCSRSVHILFKRKMSWNEFCGETTPHMNKFQQRLWKTILRILLRFPLFLAFFFVDLTAATQDVDSVNHQRRWRVAGMTVFPQFSTTYKTSLPFKRCLSTKHIA
jgi:hypothetical protein